MSWMQSVGRRPRAVRQVRVTKRDTDLPERLKAQWGQRRQT